MNSPFEQLHYEQPELWDEDNWQQAALDKQRAELVAEVLPASVQTILDAGSGNGIFEQNSIHRFSTIALDRSLAALRHMDVPRCQGDITNMPFPDNSFDAVVSMEVIEHLPHRSFEPALSEFVRLSRRYILITVPYCEDLRETQVICPQCLCQFHRYYHQRSFDKNKLVTLFSPKYPVQCVFVKGICEVQTKEFPRLWQFIINIYRKRKKYFPKSATCPQCGYQRGNIQKNIISPPLTRTGSRVNQWVKSNWPVRTTFEWWLALYEKQGQG